MKICLYGGPWGPHCLSLSPLFPLCFATECKAALPPGQVLCIVSIPSTQLNQVPMFLFFWHQLSHQLTVYFWWVPNFSCCSSLLWVKGNSLTIFYCAKLLCVSVSYKWSQWRMGLKRRRSRACLSSFTGEGQSCGDLWTVPAKTMAGIQTWRTANGNTDGRVPWRAHSTNRPETNPVQDQPSDSPGPGQDLYFFHA